MFWILALAKTLIEYPWLKCQKSIFSHAWSFLIFIASFWKIIFEKITVLNKLYSCIFCTCIVYITDYQREIGCVFYIHVTLNSIYGSVCLCIIWMTRASNVKLHSKNAKIFIYLFPCKPKLSRYIISLHKIVVISISGLLFFKHNCYWTLKYI